MLLTRIQDAFKWSKEQEEEVKQQPKPDAQMMTSPGDNDKVEPDLAAPLLEAQSSFAENDQAAAGYKTEPAKFDPEDLRDDIMEDDAEIGALQLMFECPIKNLVEFSDQKGVP